MTLSKVIILIFAIIIILLMTILIQLTSWKSIEQLMIPKMKKSLKKPCSSSKKLLKLPSLQEEKSTIFKLVWPKWLNSVILKKDKFSIHWIWAKMLKLKHRIFWNYSYLQNKHQMNKLKQFWIIIQKMVHFKVTTSFFLLAKSNKNVWNFILQDILFKTCSVHPKWSFKTKFFLWSLWKR